MQNQQDYIAAAKGRNAESITAMDRYMQSICEKLAALADNAAQTRFLKINMNAWAERENRLFIACKQGKPNPFTPPLSAMQIAYAANALAALLPGEAKNGGAA